MKTNKDEILKSALLLFMSVNYEKASLSMVTKMVGLTKTGIFNYFSTKQELFVAVADKYLFAAQDPKLKFDESNGSLENFIEKYVQGVDRTMSMILELGNSLTDRTANAGYFHFIQQVSFYYPNAQSKIREMINHDYEYWRVAIRKAIENGEIPPKTDIENATCLFRQIFTGLSYEMSFFGGLDVAKLRQQLLYAYRLIKAA